MSKAKILKTASPKAKKHMTCGKRRRLRTTSLLYWGFALSIVFVLTTATVSIGRITVTGTQAQRNKLARWLTLSLRGNDPNFSVTIDANGVLSVTAGGNAAATRLRNMANDPNVDVTISLVDANDRVFFGAWRSEDPNNPTGKTTGTQIIDINDLEAIGNVRNSYGFTPDMVIMHEIAEGYEGQKHHADCWSYFRSHTQGGIPAEREVMKENGTSWLPPRFAQDPSDPNYFIMKIRRREPNTPNPHPEDPNRDPNHVIVRINPDANTPQGMVEWLRERIDCNTTSGLIAIPDPDPQVHILKYDFDGNHTIIDTWDTKNSFPTAAAFAPSGQLYVTENLAVGYAEIRVFDRTGNLVKIITGADLVNPKGIDVDRWTGEVFVAVNDCVLRYDSNWNLLGSYTTSDVNFDPTDVAVWRNDKSRVQCRYFNGEHIYAIFVTDRATSLVYRFDVEADMDTGTYTLAFGRWILDAPEGLTVGDYDGVWVASTGNNRICLFHSNGQPVMYNDLNYFVEDTTRSFFDLVMVDGDGIYVVDETPQQGAILHYDFEGQLVSTIGQDILQCPHSIAIQFTVDSNNLVPLHKSTDFNYDGRTNFTDFSYLSRCWLQTYDIPVSGESDACELVDTAPPPFGDTAVAIDDLAFFAAHWLTRVKPECSPSCDLDGNGIVNIIDATLFEECMYRPAVGHCAGADWNCDESVEEADMEIFLEACSLSGTE